VLGNLIWTKDARGPVHLCSDGFADFPSRFPNPINQYLGVPGASASQLKIRAGTIRRGFIIAGYNVGVFTVRQTEESQMLSHLKSTLPYGA